MPRAVRFFVKHRVVSRNARIGLCVRVCYALHTYGKRWSLSSQTSTAACRATLSLSVWRCLVVCVACVAVVPCPIAAAVA